MAIVSYKLSVTISVSDTGLYIPADKVTVGCFPIEAFMLHGLLNDRPCKNEQRKLQSIKKIKDV